MQQSLQPSLPSYLPSRNIERAISWLYERVSLQCLIDNLDRSSLIPKAAIVEFFIIGRLVFAAALLYLPPSGVGVIFVGFFIYDILIAHTAHLLNERVGSAGENARFSTSRSLIIAGVNVGILSGLFGAAYRYVENLAVFDAVQIALSSLTTLGAVTPTTTSGLVVMHLHALTTLFMLAVVVSTVLSGFRPRSDLSIESGPPDAA